MHLTNQDQRAIHLHGPSLSKRPGEKTCLLAVVFGVAFIIANAQRCVAQGPATQPADLPVELEVLQGYAGVWDAQIKVWAQGPDNPPLEFSGVETNRRYGQFWLSSDLDTTFQGRTTRVHSIIGYDLDAKQLVGTIIDEGPYRATMTGQYDPETKTTVWTVQAKMPDGTPMTQKSVITQVSPTKRILVLKMPQGPDGPPGKFMEIEFTRRPTDDE